MRFASTITVVAPVVAAALLAAAPGRAQDAATLGEIQRVWQERHRVVDTARLGWTFELTFSSDQASRLIADSTGGEMTATPDAELKLPASRSSVVLSADRVRYESTGASFASGERGAPVPHLSAFDGQVQQYLTDRTGRPNQRSQGSIGNMGAFDEWQNSDLLPITFALRPLRPEAFGPDTGRWRVDPRPSVVDGRQCVVISSADPKSPPEARHQYNFYLDLNRKFVPLRVTSVTDGHVIIKIAMRYEREGELFWIPSGWTSTWFTRQGKVMTVSEIRDVDATINEPVPDKTFQIEFPVGTVITDKRKGNQHFIVQKNGSWSPYDPHTALIDKRKAMIAAQQPGGMMPWLVGAGICLIAGLGFARWRRWV